MDINDDFISTVLSLSDDYEGEVVATLVSAKANRPEQKSVLYLHGFVDYFFQAHMAEAFVNEGYNFYALDLRKYGRSILPHQHQNYCQDMNEYYEEVTRSIEEITKVSGEEIFLLGHSTGGLLACNYMVDGEARSEIKALMLNSPFLELNFPKYLKSTILTVSELIGTVSAYANVKKALSPAYAQSLHKDFHGEWDFDLNWKPIEGFPAYFRWTSSIIKAQKKLKAPEIKVPILVMHAEVSKNIKVYREEAKTADIVLNVDDIKSIGAQLGEDVTLVSIENGLHDLFLSKPEVREMAFNKMFSWLNVH